MAELRKLFCVSTFEYTRGPDDKSTISLLTWNFPEALQEAKIESVRYPGRDNIMEDTSDNSYSCNFNYNYGGGTIIVSAEEVSDRSLERDASAKLMLKFLTANNVVIPSTVSRKEHLSACICELMKNESNCHQKIKDMIVQFEIKEKPTTCIEHATRKSTCGLSKSVIPVGELRFGVGKLGRRIYWDQEPAIEYKWFKYDTIFDTNDKLDRKKNLLTDDILKTPSNIVGYDKLTSEEQADLKTKCDKFRVAVIEAQLFAKPKADKKRKYVSGWFD